MTFRTSTPAFVESLRSLIPRAISFEASLDLILISSRLKDAVRACNEMEFELCNFQTNLWLTFCDKERKKPPTDMFGTSRTQREGFEVRLVECVLSRARLLRAFLFPLAVHCQHVFLL